VYEEGVGMVEEVEFHRRCERLTPIESGSASPSVVCILSQGGRHHLLI
jgi:hypothetical protein